MAALAAAAGPVLGILLAPVPPWKPSICSMRPRRSYFNGGGGGAPNISAIGKQRRPPLFCCWPHDSCYCCSFSVKRREATLYMSLSLAALLLPLLVASPAHALDEVPEAFRVYSDDVNKYKIYIPQDWQVGSGDAKGIKSVIAFYPEEASTSNVSVVITGLGPDFTRLESFGKVDGFAENLVSGLDRSWQRPPGVAAKLIDSKSANGLYYIEYTLQKPGESCRHIYTAIAIGNNGWYNRLYTVTGQFLEEESGRYSSKIEKAVQSFRLN